MRWRGQVEAHAGTVMAGRTHGQQAVPTTFGAKLATFLRQVHPPAGRPRGRPRRECCLVSLHGAAGTSAGFGPRAGEVRAADGSPSSGWTLPDGPWHVTRDGLATFGAVCARAAACARDWRARSSTSRAPRSARSARSEGHHRGASSTMPQKANPIDSEAIVGMAVSVTATSASLYRAMEAGHERSAGEWQIEWHVIPQVAVLTAGCLLVAGRVVREALVYPERMAANLAASRAGPWPRPTCSSWRPSSAARPPTTSSTRPPPPRRHAASSCAGGSRDGRRASRRSARSSPPTTWARRARRPLRAVADWRRDSRLMAAVSPSSRRR